MDKIDLLTEAFNIFSSFLNDILAHSEIKSINDDLVNQLRHLSFLVSWVKSEYFVQVLDFHLELLTDIDGGKLSWNQSEKLNEKCKTINELLSKNDNTQEIKHSLPVNDDVVNVEGYEKILTLDYEVKDNEHEIIEQEQDTLNVKRKKNFKEQCEKCQEKFTTFINLLMHIYHEHDQTCTVCGFKSVSFTHLHGHVTSHRTKHVKALQRRSYRYLSCDKCNFSAKRLRILTEHMYKEHDQTRCDICEKESTNFDSLWEHRKTHSYERFVCKICGKKVIGKKFHIHMGNHVDNSTSICSICGKAIKKRFLEQHLSRMHDIQSVKCTICGKDYRKSYLKIHMKQAHLEKEECPWCGVKVKQYLGNHLWKFGCNLPEDQKLKTKYQTKATCDICGKVLTNIYQLHQHTSLLHDPNSKKYNCDLCDYKSYKNQHIQTHMRLKHGKKSCIL